MKPVELVVFKSGNSSAVRLPKSLGFEPGQKLVAFLEGEALLLKHTDTNGWPLGYFDSWEAKHRTTRKKQPGGPHFKTF